MTASSEEYSGLSGFMGGLYCADVRFSYLPGFAQEVRDGLRGRSFRSRDESIRYAISKAREGVSRVQHVNVIDSPEIARQYAESRDLETIIDKMIEVDWATVALSEEEIRVDLREASSSAARVLGAYGLAFGKEPVEVYFVEKMPPPYDQKNTAALVVDTEDEREYGIKQGVYFLGSSVRPYYTKFIFLHELLHVIFGRQDPDRVAHGLEEGLCDLLGSIWLASEIIGPELTRKLFVLNRLSSSYNPFWERYLDSARQAFWYATSNGFDSLINLARGGRASFYEVERDISQELAINSLLGVPDRDLRFLRFAASLLLSYPRAYVCSAHALLFAEQVQSGYTVREISTRAKLSPSLGLAAARELRDELGLLFLRKDEVVVIEGTPAQILRESWLRYDSE